MTNKSIILLSGGLDSLVSLGILKNKYNITLALTFDYGQKSVKQEITTSKNICDFYGLKHKIIKLEWLKEVTHNSLTEDKIIPNGIQDNANSFWVPNRNSLFLNIAASIADGEGYSHIIFGANQEEAEKFSDNTQSFVDKVNSCFQSSTSNKVEVIAPLINLDKNDIVKLAIDKEIPLEFVYSCYGNSKKNCGKCESCIRLKQALIANDAEKYIGILFE